MKRILIGALALSLATVVHAGSGCTHSTQECLDRLAKDLGGRGWLGVELEGTDKGMTIRKVVDASPAAKAGLEPGDVLVSVNGRSYATMTEADHEALRKVIVPGGSAQYVIQRAGKNRDLAVTLGAMPDQVRAQIVGAHMLEHSALAAEERASIMELSVDQAAELLESGRAVAVDANGREVREKFGVIPGAALLTSASAWSASEVPASAKDKMLVFYCANKMCTASDAAAKLARERGHEKVGILRAGIMGWKDAGRKTASPSST